MNREKYLKKECEDNDVIQEQSDGMKKIRGKRDVTKERVKKREKN